MEKVSKAIAFQCCSNKVYKKETMQCLSCTRIGNFQRKYTNRYHIIFLQRQQYHSTISSNNPIAHSQHSYEGRRHWRNDSHSNKKHGWHNFGLPTRLFPLRANTTLVDPNAGDKNKDPNKKETSPLDNEPKTETKKIATTDTLRRIIELSKPEAKLISLAAATLGITSSVTLLLPTASGQVIDSAIQAAQGTAGADAFSPTLVALGLFGLVSLAGSGVYVRSLLLQKAGNRIVSRTKQRLFQAVLTQDAAYFDTIKKGDILSRLSTDSQLIQGAVTTQAISVLRGIVMSFGSTVMMFQTSATLAFVSLGTLPPMFVAARTVGRKLRDKQGEVQKLHGKATSTAEEVIGGIKTVTQFVAERHELKRYSHAVVTAHDAAIRAGKTQAMFDGAVHVGANGAILCVLGYGGTLVLDGTISAGDLTGFLMYSLILAGNVSGLSGTYAEMMKAVAAADRIFEVIDLKPQIRSCLVERIRDDSEGDAAAAAVVRSSTTLPTISKSNALSVEFRNISFSYPSRPEKQIIGPGFTLTIRPGERIALVGGSGSGKSTLAALLTRLYDVDPTKFIAKSNVGTRTCSPKDDRSGAIGIFVDGHDIRHLDPEDLRQSVGIVSQEPLLFEGTIEDNIRYGNRSATKDDVLEAARIAHVLEFASTFPDGLQTKVGSRGAQLSGGQKQRVAIARCFVKNPPIVVFDEATSALDAQSEHHVKEAIDTVMKGRTVISIAHRLSTIRGADRIAVLHEGSIAEVGTYDELVQKEDGAFRSLMGRQLIGMVGNESF